MPGTRRSGAAAKKDESNDELVTALLTASRALVAVAARSLAEHNESVTIAQFRALVVLGNQPDLSLNQLADQLGVNPSTAMRMINRLLRSELVTRRDNPDDRREILLALTAAGREIVDTVTRRRRSEINRIVAAMPAPHRGELITVLHAFAEAAGEPEAQVSALDW
ncbi:MarR family transcriptional regulator [Microlunatus endophyticus]|uniref:MarR family transcriptional regulator n=1 Tax=Microlunatus endophyticus TaxID=1716077 RepID=A0A917SIH3_9ACTN|nr:MarR family transcriptional regulator [Microlunatus endophyticus]GGL79681.1 MarR family transcriptional regulator [Microlunatus endophyticus]